MHVQPPCLKCNSNFVYQEQNQLICPECAYEWNLSEALAEEELLTIKDANGTPLNEGDKVTMIKDLKIKGSSQVLKVGTKAVIKQIVEGKDHQLDCKVDGFGAL
jgi:protein PhnA